MAVFRFILLVNVIMGVGRYALFLIFATIVMMLFEPSLILGGERIRRFAVVKQEGEWRLLCDGEPFYIKGAVGEQSMDLLRAYGANSVRTRANVSSLNRAHAFGLTAMAGLPVRGERNGMDWDNESMVAEQADKVLTVVEELKHHPAVMIWAIGNELDYIPPNEPYNPILWKRLNDIARRIKEIDPNHMVLTVVGSGRFEEKIQQIARYCIDMDLLGLNAYGDLDEATNLIRTYWPKPYVVAEWGPTGHWQTPKTKWRAPIEQSSSEKAQVIVDRYTSIILNDRAHCVGSYVFYWSEKQETTHTWYGLFRDGMKTESIDVMKWLWSGTWPENRAPVVLGIAIDGMTDQKQLFLQPNTTYYARVYCWDGEYDSLRYEWDIRPEVVIPRNSYAGSLEKPAQPIPGSIVSEPGMRIQFKTPAEKGPYRLFVQITDGRQNAGYANVPFYVGNMDD